MSVKSLEKERCCGCVACKCACPNNSIFMQMDEEGFYYPVVQDSCIHCDKCERVCPAFNNPNAEIVSSPHFFVTRARDKEIRQRSSSGAIAYSLSKKFLTENQIVCGVRMNSDYSYAEHVCIDNIEELDKLLGSKYLQSNTDGIYEKIRCCIKDDKKVLFIGTPCQVAAVKNVFKNTENIIYVDLICHGVPSQFLWKKYHEYISKKYKSNINFVNFRDKSRGWEQFGFRACFENGKSLYVPRGRGFLGLFLANICLRPVCGKCEYKGFNRCSDITIGDFWGIERVLPDYEKSNGVSIAMINSKKGMDLFKSLGQEIEFEEVECRDLFQSRNKSLLKPVKISEKRMAFIEDLKTMSFPALENKYLGNPFIVKVKIKVKRLLNK